MAFIRQRLHLTVYLGVVASKGYGAKAYLISAGYTPRQVHRKAWRAELNGYTLDGSLTAKGQAYVEKQNQ